MLTATLGGLIKDYRIKKRLSQQSVALRIGWSDTTRLSKIEQGRVGKPTRETLNRVMDALELSEQEKGQMLLASGILPTKEETQQVVARLKKITSSFRYPLILVDFAWFVSYFNDSAKEVFQLTKKEYKFIGENNPHWFEMFFLRKSFNDINIRGGLSEHGLLGFAEHEIALFKYEQVANTEERWFRNVLSKMSKDARFRELWARVEPYRQEHILYEYEVNTFKSVWSGKEEILKFHVFSIHPTFDFRFYLMIHQPIDESTFRFYIRQGQEAAV